MKKSFVLLASLLSLPVLDYAAAGLNYSLADTAEAYAARRSAFVARGPAGGVAVGARRTAFGRRGYGFLSSSGAMDKNKVESEFMAESQPQKSTELNMKESKLLDQGE